MFQGIIQKIKEVFNNFMNKDTIKQQMKVDIAISNVVSDFIDRCINIYKNNPPWRNDNKGIYSMNLGAGIASEFAKLVTIEFKSEISNNDFLNEDYQAVIDNMRNHVELACAGGGIVFKPYLSNGHIEVDIVQADSIYPVSFNSRGEMTAVILPETKVTGDYTYTRLEYHSLNNTDHTIMNKAFKKKNYNTNISIDSSIGEEIQLTEVEEWANLAPQVIFHNVEKPLFSYFKMPNKNTIDLNSPLGVSIFAKVADINGLLQQADEQYSRIIWEFKSKETAIHVDLDLIKENTDNGNLYMEEGLKRLYRKMDIDSMASGSKQIDVYSPDIRDMSLYNGLNNIKREIEFQVGLAYGSLSEVAETAKTATEIKMSKQRSFTTIKDIDNNLRIALECLVYAMSYLGQVGKLPVKPVDLKKDLEINFGDSILTDKKEEDDSMYLDVSSGFISNLYYIMKKYKVTEEEAKKMMPSSQGLVTENKFDEGLDPNTGMPIDMNTNDDSVVDAAEEVTNKQLNGAQTQSLVAVLAQYSANQLTLGQAINVIAIAIGITKEEAKKIIEGSL